MKKSSKTRSFFRDDAVADCEEVIVIDTLPGGTSSPQRVNSEDHYPEDSFKENYL